MYLNCHTFYSIKYGTLSPRELVSRAVARGVASLVLTDINNTSAAIEFYDLCKSHQIVPVLGIEFWEGGQFKYIGIARNKRGWTVLNELLTGKLVDSIPLPNCMPYHEDVFVIYPINKVTISYQLHTHAFLALEPKRAGFAVHTLTGTQNKRLVLVNSVTFGDRTSYMTHKLLRCIDANICYTKLNKELLAGKQEQFLSAAQLEHQSMMWPIAYANAQSILDKCESNYFCDRRPNQRLFTGEPAADRQLLKSLAKGGLNKRFQTVNPTLLHRLNSELEMIFRLDFTGYFLLAWDAIRFATRQGFHYVGRGSGANSLTAYCLGITDVDPIELNLYFERFINPHRPEPPDFDIDFNWTDRDQVISYLINRYGSSVVSLLATYQTFKGKSIVRELGKVLGLPKREIDCIVREPLAQHKHHPLAHTIFKYGRALQGFPRHLSIHAGGVIIAKNCLTNYGSRQMMPKGFAITQFDMHHAASMGFHKFDILSQRGIGHIGDAVKIIRDNRGSVIDIHDMQMIKQDAKTSTLLTKAEAIGCFYIESPAMRGLLSKLKCNNYQDLVAATSIIRPGVAKSGMMSAYVRRHLGSSFNYLHPAMKQLKETYGIMVYQEDVMQVVSTFAGFDLYQADMLRRLMTGKQKDHSILARLRKAFIQAACDRGHARSLVLEIWRQIESFSGYAFCKAHSATYAAESLQSLFLKAHYPAEFLVAVINNFGGFYATEVYVRALQKVAQVCPPCLNSSRYLTCIRGDRVYLGFTHIKGLRQSVVTSIAAARNQGGAFKSMVDAMSRLDISLGQWQLLITAGALRYTGEEKYELHRTILREHHLRAGIEPSLFEPAKVPCPVAHDPAPEYQDSWDEISTLGFSLRSPFKLLQHPLPAATILAKQMTAYRNRQVRMMGYFVTRKPVTTASGKHMCFAAFEDAKGDYFDTVHFPATLDRYPIDKKGVYLLVGKVVCEFEFPSLEVISLQHLPMTEPDQMSSLSGNAS